MIKKLLLSLILALVLISCQKERHPILAKGSVITTSVSIPKDTFRINGSDSLWQPVWTIEGNDLLVDFNGAVLVGSNDQQWPDDFYGTGILIKGNNIILKNLSVRGFKVAVLAEGADSLQIVDCDLSYNYRQHLKSTREREDFADWLSYHQNDEDEWLRYGAAIYLKNCNRALVKNVAVSGGQNGLMLSGCHDGMFYNNEIQFNSGVGIGLYRSNRNRVMHNRLDWNVRGYSHNIYQRGQDSAGILVYEQSNDNTFAYNSATHSGDGFFLWAGQSTMDSGEGGCNNNLIFKNDFSYAPTNGVEVTFSRNRIIANKMEECRYGIWGGYSFESEFLENIITNCDYGIAIEHGNNNQISNNYFQETATGVQLWERKNQPADWGFAAKRNVSSRDYVIRNNIFSAVKEPLKIDDTPGVMVEENTTYQSGTINNTINAHLNWQAAYNGTTDAEPAIPGLNDRAETAVPRLPDGIDPYLKADRLTGRQYILVDEWGPHDFRSPSIWLRTVEDDRYTFLLLGPATGNYKITGGDGWAKLNRVSGAFPATLVATKKPEAVWLSLHLEFIGEAFTDRFGHYNKKGKIYRFGYSRFEKTFDWRIRFYNYDENTDPINNYEAFRALKDKPAQKAENKNELYYAWWGSPGDSINADKFATFSETEFDIKAGKYLLHLTSDDGAKLFLDGKLLIDHWDIHEPATDVVEVDLGGRHRIEIEHFEGGGFGTLDFRIEMLKK